MGLFEFLPRLRQPLLKGRPDSQPVQLGAPDTRAKSEDKREMKVSHPILHPWDTSLACLVERKRATLLPMSLIFFRTVIAVKQYCNKETPQLVTICHLPMDVMAVKYHIGRSGMSSLSSGDQIYPSFSKE